MNETPPGPQRRRGVPPSGKPTLRTIAKMTGFATTTISRALNNAPELSAETRELVQKVAAEVGYLPDRAALRLKTGRTNVITLVLAPNEEILGFGSSLVGGLTAAMQGSAYHLVITPNFRNVSPMEPIRHIVRNRMADGIVFSRTEFFDERVTYLLEENFPFVSHGRTHWPTPHPYVDFDNDAFTYAAVKRLVAKGRRRIAIILPLSSLTYSEHMRTGFVRAVAETGVDHEIAADVTLDSPADVLRDYVMRRLKRPGAPDGYICGSEVSALSAIAGLTDSGVAVGVDVDVIAKSASPLFDQFRPRVETVLEDVQLAGRKLGELLMRRIDGEPVADLQFLDRPTGVELR